MALESVTIRPNLLLLAVHLCVAAANDL